MPKALAHVWRWFLELSAARPQGISGVAPVTWEGMEAWARLTGERPRPSEVQLLRRLDEAFRTAMNEED